MHILIVVFIHIGGPNNTKRPTDTAMRMLYNQLAETHILKCHFSEYPGKSPYTQFGDIKTVIQYFYDLIK